MSRVAIAIALVATARVAAADVEPPHTEVPWETVESDACHLADRTEPATTCKLLAKTTVIGVGTFALHDIVSWHDIWVTEMGADGTRRVLEVSPYGSRSSAGHSRTPSHFVASARSFANAAGFELTFDLEEISGHDGSHSRSHERVFIVCDDASCRIMPFGGGPWVKHDCAPTGWAAKSTVPLVGYACTGYTAL